MLKVLLAVEKKATKVVLLITLPPSVVVFIKVVALFNGVYCFYFRGVVMVGPGAVVNVQYFKEIGGFDMGMTIWGGENLELPWRVGYSHGFIAKTNAFEVYGVYTYVYDGVFFGFCLKIFFFLFGMF